MNGMFWFQLVVIVALLAAVGWLAVGGGGHMSEPAHDRPDLALPREGLIGRRDVDRVRFSVGARGYRMDEVDDVLDRLAHEIDLRERRIAELEGRAPGEEGVEAGFGAASEPGAPEPTASDFTTSESTVEPYASEGPASDGSDSAASESAGPDSTRRGIAPSADSAPGA